MWSLLFKFKQKRIHLLWSVCSSFSLLFKLGYQSKHAMEEIHDIPTDDNENNLFHLIDLPNGEIIKGVLLPNSVQDWESAHEFFRTNIHHNANIEDVNSKIRDMQNTI